MLIANSGLDRDRLIEIGSDHRLADPGASAAMLAAAVRWRPRGEA